MIITILILLFIVAGITFATIIYDLRREIKHGKRDKKTI